jgi:membrane protease YdiL (CAAX protease family)
MGGRGGMGKTIVESGRAGERESGRVIERRGRVIEVAIAFEGTIAVLAWVLAWILGVPLGDLAQVTWGALGIGVVLTLPPLAVMWVTSEIRLAPFERIRREIDEIIGTLFGRASLLDLAMISLLAGVGEEALFRGVLQTTAAGWSTSLWGLVAASVLFGLMHFVTPTYAMLATAIGAYLGWLFLAFDNLVVPMAVHGIYDFVALVYLRRTGGREDGRTVGSPDPHRHGGTDGQWEGDG